MARKFSIKSPTHKIVDGETCYALVRAGKNSPAVKLLSTGETQRSASFLLDCDLLMGRWHGPVSYLFGHDADHVPETAKMIPL